MLSYHRRMFAFDHWANRVSLDAVARHVEAVPRSLAWLNHVLGAKCVWLARVTGTTSRLGVNPALGGAEPAAQFDLVHAGWMQFLDAQGAADLAGIAGYTNAKGQRFALGDILAHVPVHGQHHRGQVNADLRAAGLTPPSIDYIHAARAGLLD